MYKTCPHSQSKIKYQQVKHWMNAQCTEIWIYSFKNSKSLKVEALCSLKTFTTNYQLHSVIFRKNRTLILKSDYVKALHIKSKLQCKVHN